MQIGSTAAYGVQAQVPGLSVTAVSDVLGVEISGLDVTDADSVERHWTELNDLLREHHVIVFRDQPMTEAGLETFARPFGDFERSVTQRADGTISPAIHTITNLDANGKPSKTPYINSNYFWHSDRAFFKNGSAMVMLHGTEIPPKGGDTQFANMILAYEGLSAADRELVDGLQVVHSFEHMRNNLMKRPLSDVERAQVPPPSVHPMVRTDPRTGKRSLFLGMYACEVVGMPVEDGQKLIKRLEEHSTQPKYVYTHVWKENDFIIWDNLCLLHRALPNYEMGEYRRIMLRCGIKSELPIQ